MVAETAPGLHPTRYWHALSDGRVQCDVCPRGCRLREGQRGLCFVRMRRGEAVMGVVAGGRDEKGPAGAWGGLPGRRAVRGGHRSAKKKQGKAGGDPGR